MHRSHLNILEFVIEQIRVIWPDHGSIARRNSLVSTVTKV